MKLWQRWIQGIACDEQMDFERCVQHLQTHVRDHMPSADDNPLRWEQWLAGTYNLVGILSAMKGVHPSFELGISRLFNKFRQHPFDHTPPPEGTVEVCRAIYKGRSNA